MTLKSSGSRISGFNSHQINKLDFDFKRGSVLTASVFYQGEIWKESRSLYRIEVRIIPTESLSTFSETLIDQNSNSYKRLISHLNNKLTSDVSFDVDGSILYASTFLLLANDYFKALLNGKFIESAQSKSLDTPIVLREVKPETFIQILQWLYTGDIPMIWKPSALFELHRTADYFLMDDLCKAIIEFIMGTFCEYNFGQVYEFAVRIGDLELEKAVVKDWKENRALFLATNEIKDLIERNPGDEYLVRLIRSIQGVDTSSDLNTDIKVSLIDSLI